uniref:RNA-directed DNA polymerase n=1 Tax=Lactuca sativa TaxID=4236 RepID=A0A9R1W3U1_LACSA|nr:hypothetical protein LSAT_V11C300116250 [Lactuca sativa]
MKETISERLEKYFFNLQYEDYDKTDQKLIQLLSLETEECEELYQKEPKLFDQYFRMTKINEPDTESEQEDNFKTNTKTVKFEYSDMEDDEAESSYTATRRGNKKKYEFKMPVHNGIPNSGQGPNTINVLNIDCIQDLKLRERVVEKWVTEISLILQTNPDEFEKAKNVLLLLEHKTDGIVQKFLRNNNWNEELHGSDLFDNLINVIYTTFLGLDYISNKDFTINKKVDIARVSMTKLQLHDISLLDKYTCMYESYLYDIPQRSEYAQWISAYLMKIPIIGETCTDRWKKEATGEIQQTSLSYATKIAKEEIDRICQDRYKQQKLKTISKDCCSILSDFKNFDIGKKNYTKKKYKNKKKYKSFWKKKRRKFSPGKYFKKPSKETPKKTTSCPQGKKKCRCWICNEEGHYANECPNRKKYPDKVKVLQTANNGGYEALEEEYDGASLCLASKFIIPDELWENAPKEISATIANGETIKINKVCRNINLELSGEHFNVPTIYQQNSGIDIIIGNNFCQVYGPFIQWIDRIAFHLNNDMVIIKKVTEAYSKGKPGFLETQEKGSKEKQIPGTNITHEEINKERIISIQTTRFKQIEDLLEKVCSENPIDPNKTKGWMKASIKLIDPKTVIREKPMVYSLQDREEFSKQIKELLDMRLIIESKSPHMSPAFLVNKDAEKRRGKKRMVVNYKAINDATIGDSHNLPNMHELLTLLRGKNIYSSFDCKSGFWQVLLDEESQLLTAFTCPDGLFQWKVLPFGLKQAPSIFQRHMQNALRGLEGFCTVYVDDIMIFSKNEQEHYVHVTQVLRTILKYGIILSKKKAHLFKTKINFLGLEINEGTHCPQKHILEHLHDFPNVLEDKKQLQRFLGVLTYAETYIEKLAAMRKPLQAKLKKDVIWNWSNADTDYIKKIKKVLINFPKLYLPNIEDSLIIETDASDEFWGGVLKAKNPKNEEQICRYTSGSFKAAEKNYHSNEKELLAVKRVITKFSVYLTPVNFLVRTDNKNFTYFLRTKIAGDNKLGRLIRWQEWFSRYTFTVEHLAGNKNVLADCLTRDFRYTLHHP